MLPKFISTLYLKPPTTIEPQDERFITKIKAAYLVVSARNLNKVIMAAIGFLTFLSIITSVLFKPLLLLFIILALIACIFGYALNEKEINRLIKKYNL